MKNSNKAKNNYIGKWMLFGMSIGVAIGAAMNQIALGIPIGMAIGVAIGSEKWKAANKNNSDKG